MAGETAVAPVATTPAASQNNIPQITNTGYSLPQWYGDLSQQFANTQGGMLDAYGTLGQNWYDQPLSAGLTDAQTQAIGQYGPSGPIQGALSQYATQYDPSQTAKFMDPYTQQAIKGVYNLSNQNLRENILPGVNSTFTGAGQFGSSRNADFENRAIRDSQQAADNTVGSMLNNQWNNAMTQQFQWNQNPLVAAGALGTAAGQQFGMGTQAQTTAQGALDKNYQNWLNQIQLPQQMISNSASMIPNYSSMYRPSSTSTQASVTPNTTTGQGILDLIARLNQVLGG